MPFVGEFVGNKLGAVDAQHRRALLHSGDSKLAGKLVDLPANSFVKPERKSLPVTPRNQPKLSQDQSRFFCSQLQSFASTQQDRIGSFRDFADMEAFHLTMMGPEQHSLDHNAPRVEPECRPSCFVVFA
jgi:hypothetical protein